VAALGTGTERQNPVRVEARMAWGGKGWIVDVVTQPWAQAIEEELKGGDGSSSEVRGGHAGVSVDVEKQGTDSEGKNSTRKKSQASVERASRRWRRRTARRRLGEELWRRQSRAGEQKGLRGRR
jgi:hypothetical protein